MPDHALVTLDKALVLTTIFTIVDDAMKLPHTAVLLRRPGPTPTCSDAEIITIALYQELLGDPREDHFYRLHTHDLKGYFPTLPERSRYNRRKRSLCWIILAVRMTVLIALGAHTVRTAAIDSAPCPVTGYKRPKSSTWFSIAAYGRCASKAMKYFGCKLTTLVSLTGIILDFVVTAANHYDNQVVYEFLAQYKGTLSKLIGDKAYNDQALQQAILESFQCYLKAPKKDNQVIASDDPFVSSKTEAGQRLMVEGVNSQLQEQLHLSKHYAKSVDGYFTRISAKVTAHSVGMLINTIWGRKPLALAGLAV